MSLSEGSKLSSDHKTIVLSADRHMKKIIRLPYAPDVRTSVIPIANDAIYFAFEKTLSYPPIGKIMTSSDLFGVGEIDISNNFEVRSYPLPIGFPMKRSVSELNSMRLFKLVCQSGSDLIFYIEGPLRAKRRILYTKYVQHHFVFAFETESRRWCRVTSVGRDGTYHKQPIPVSGDIGTFPSDRPRNALRSNYGRFIIWSPMPGKLGIGFNDEPDDIDERRPEIEKYYDEWFRYLEPIKSKNFSSGAFGEPLELGKFISKPDYRIFGVKEVIEAHDPSFQEELGKEIRIVSANSVLFRRNSVNTLGVFVSYHLAGTWGRGVFLVFEY